MTEREIRTAFKLPATVKVHGGHHDGPLAVQDATYRLKVEANVAARKAKIAAEKAVA